MKGLIFSCLLLLCISCATVDSGDGHAAWSKQVTGAGAGGVKAPAVHGMLLFGGGPVYLSHLPMFHRPHDHQAIFEVEFIKTGADPLAVYVQDRQHTGETVYTVVPEAFSLPELFGPVGGLPQRTSFRATIVRGHFERGGSPLLSEVTVKIKAMILAKKFQPEAAALAQLKYFVFGNQNELFAVHSLTKRPDFDQVLEISLASALPTAELAHKVRAGVFVDFAGIANDAEHALKAGGDFSGRFDLGGDARVETVRVGNEIYKETGDLSF